MARSKKRSVTIPHPIDDGIKLQRERGITNYRSDNAAYVGLARYALIKPGPHPITEAIDQMHPDKQDIIDDFLLELNERGLNLGGSFLRHVVDRAVKGLVEPEYTEVQRLSAEEILTMAQRHHEGDQTIWTELASES